MVILEEMNVAVHLGFLTIEEVLEIIGQKPMENGSFSQTFGVRLGYVFSAPGSR